MANTFNTNAIINDNTKFEQMDDELNVLMGDVKTYLETEVEILVDDINVVASEANTIKDEAESAKVEAENSAAAAESAANRAEAVVIPTEATYSPDAIDALVQKQRTELFLGFDF